MFKSLRSHISLASFLCLQLSVGAQTDDYTPLRSYGGIPTDFTMLSIEKYQQDVATMDRDGTSRQKKSKREFYLESNYHVDALLNSGKVIFGDEVTAYVNKVADKAMVGNPALRAEVRIYVIKSPVVNAFATNNGIIFISTGLIAQLENEAQLAFVLCHEATHVRKEHSLLEHVEKDEMRAQKGKYRQLDQSDLFLMSRKYSKELETEADLEGLELLAKSSYDLTAVDGLFDVLLYADLPFDDVGFSTSFFQSADYVFPDNYTYKEDMVIEERDEDKDDEKSTHPNVKKRKSAVKDKRASTTASAERFVYLVSKETFLRERKICRFEICRELLLDRDYAFAFYNAYMLLQDNPDSKYLKKIVQKSLYYLAKDRIYSEGLSLDIVDREVEGNAKSVFYFFDQLSESEMVILALRYSYAMKNQYTDDAEVNLMYTDLVYHFAKKYSSLDKFIMTPREQYLAELTTKPAAVDSVSNEVNGEEVSKLDKIRKAKKGSLTAEQASQIPYYKFALIDLMGEGSSFKDDYDLAIERVEEGERVMSEAELKQKQKERMRNRRKGYAMGLDKVVFANPYYQKKDKRMSAERRYEVTERSQIDFNNRIAKCASIVDLDVEILNPNTMTSEDVLALNGHSIVMEWMSEKMEHDDIDDYNVSPIHNEISAFSAAHQSQFLSFVGAINVTTTRPYRLGILLLTVFYWPTLPFGIYYAATPLNTTQYFTLLWDTNKEELLLAEYKNVKMGASKSGTMSHIYYTMMQYKNRRTK